MTRRLGRVLCSEGLSEFLSVERGVPPKGLDTGRGSSGGASSLGFAKSDLEIAREKLNFDTKYKRMIYSPSFGENRRLAWRFFIFGQRQILVFV